MKRQKNELLMKKYLKPHIIYLTWTLLAVIFWFVVIPIASIGHSGGEQVPLTLLAESLGPITLGYFTISILTTILFKDWFKKYWIVNLIIFSLTTFLLTMSIINS